MHFFFSPFLSGRPSTPQVALNPTAGGLTVQLTVVYPGTREDTLQYSISTSPSPLSRRQTGQQPLPVTDLTTPTSGSAEVALGPGTYSVTVTVTNQHGSSASVPQQVTIPGRRNMVLCVQLSICLSINFVFCVLFLLKTVLVTVYYGISLSPTPPPPPSPSSLIFSRHYRQWGDCSHYWGGGGCCHGDPPPHHHNCLCHCSGLHEAQDHK